MQKGTTPEPLDLQLVVPVHNEEHSLPGCIAKLQAALHELPWKSEIVIVDNASTDSTFNVAIAEAVRHDNVRVVHLAEKGRGRALRAAWSRANAVVLAYTDVDLSTDLNALPELVGKVARGECDVAIGSRLLPDSQVQRGARREMISRVYNWLLHWTLGAQFRDAQCGFKALSENAAAQLLGEVEDNSWFFDTELLVRAQRTGMVIDELPVTWVEDTDSRVSLLNTMWEDLRGVARLMQGPQRLFLPVVHGVAALLSLFASPTPSSASEAITVLPGS